MYLYPPHCGKYVFPIYTTRVTGIADWSIGKRLCECKTLTYSVALSHYFTLTRIFSISAKVSTLHQTMDSGDMNDIMF